MVSEWVCSNREEEGSLYRLIDAGRKQGHWSGEGMAAGLSGRGAGAGSVPRVTAELMEVLMQC